MELFNGIISNLFLVRLANDLTSDVLPVPGFPTFHSKIYTKFLMQKVLAKSMVEFN